MKKGVSIIMPCLNEEKTVKICVKKALSFLAEHHLDGEVIIADNGSTDCSVQIAEENGARVVHVAGKGYGSALRGGISASSFPYIVMGDADDSYDFLALEGFIEALDEGYDLVMGNRFAKRGGGVQPGAMSFSHRYIGNPVLSGIGRIFYRTGIHDFHCGLRAFRKDSIEKIGLCTTGMEFASEMVVKATLHGLKIAEVPCKLYPDGRDRPPHLRSIPDGWRHLQLLLIYSPRWLFLYPGLLLSLLGGVLLTALLIAPLHLGRVQFEDTTMFYAAMLLLVGIQGMEFSLFSSLYGQRIGQFPPTTLLISKLERFVSGPGLILALVLCVAGVGGVILTLGLWAERGFGELSTSEVQRQAIFYGTCLILGINLLFAAFFTKVLRLKR